MNRAATGAPAAFGGGRRGGPTLPARWLTELALGARLVITGGREGWLRAGLTALGVGLGVALFLLAAAAPGAIQAREDREARRDIVRDHAPAPAADTVLVRPLDLQFRQAQVRGVVLRPEGPAAPVPPGLAELPGPGELVVSPALANLLDSSEGELLRPRLDYPIVGVIGEEGLRAPSELAFYLGGDATTVDELSGWRLDQFGNQGTERAPLHPILLLLLTVGLVVLLLPVAMFVAVAVRFGGEQRDRRLAALRLVGADAGATRLVAAGEVLVAAVLGLAAGAVLFLLGRQLAEQVVVWDISVFATDVRPDPLLVAAVAILTPALAVSVTLLAMRRLIVEPLGVVRRTGELRRRLWWRLLPPVAGLALLYPLVGQIGSSRGEFSQYRVAAGIVLLLLGVGALVPWLIDVAVRRLRGRGGVSWQLATRRLQLGGGSTGRVVNGIAVGVAGAIALQMFFTGVQDDFTTTAEIHPERVPVLATLHGDYGTGTAEELAARFATTAGVHSSAGVGVASVTDARHTYHVILGDCSELAKLAVIDRCADGDVFVGDPLSPGQRLELLDGGEWWTIPATAQTFSGYRNDWVFGETPAVLLTPGAAGDAIDATRVSVYLELEPGDPDAIEHVRNTAAGVDIGMRVWQWQAEQEDEQFADIRRGLLIGVTATLLLIGLSLLVGIVEQLRERRRQLAVLVAFGARRRTLAWSVLWQTAIPVALGLPLALAAGAGLGTLLLSMVGASVAVDRGNLAAITGIAAGVVLLMTVLAMPALWRLMRPDGLRAE